MIRARLYALTCALLAAFAAGATTIVLPTDVQLIAKSPVIVDGTVVSSEAVERDGAIRTETRIAVARALKGTVEGEITVSEIGGVVGERVTRIYGAPEFAIGERVLLFLEPHPHGGFRTVDLFVGKFRSAETTTGQRLWQRDDSAPDVQLLDAELRPIVATSNVPRDAARFETFVTERVAGRTGSDNYGVANPKLKTTPRVTSQFTLISEPTVYRWWRFDDGSSAPWYHSGTQTGYANSGISELQTGMASWVNYSSAKIRYTYNGARNGSLGGLNAPNGANEVLFGDPLSEIAGTWDPATGGTVGVGGFNGITNGGTWNAPFAAPGHPAGATQAYNIVEGNLTIQDGVSPSKGISSTVLAEIIAHEFGHTLGIGHSADSSALMYASVTGLGPSLRGDDQIAARWLYPTSNSGPTNPTAPAAPSNLTATVSGTTATLKWTDNAANETGFTIYLRVNGGGAANLGNVSANATGANITELPMGNHSAYVVAFNASGASSPSNEASFTVSQPAPVAKISASATAGTAGITNFTFNDVSTGTVTSRVWTFGDNSPAVTTATANHVYAQPGNYTVTLTVVGPGGTSNTQITVIVSGPLGAAFLWSPASPRPGDSIQFTDLSVGGPLEWEWNFGDGTSSRQQNPAKTFPSQGTYPVKLTVLRSGISASVTQQIVVSNSVPVTPVVVANFDSSATTIGPGASVSFTDRSTGTPTSWLWSFGDGASSTSQNPSHSFASAGTYTVKLVAANATSSATAEKQIVVTNVTPYRTLITVAARTAGASNTSWRTELTLFNAGDEGATATISYLPSAGSLMATKIVFLPAMQSVTFENALEELFEIESGAGALAIEATSGGSLADLRISSRTFTGSDHGTYGQSVPDVQAGALAETLFITGIQSSEAFRTNVGLANRSGSTVNASLTLYTKSGGALATKTVSLNGTSFQQTSLASLFPEVTGVDYDALSMRIEAGQANALSGYASVVDNITQDPVYIQAVPARDGDALTIPVVGRAPGANNTFWRSDVTFFNPTPSRMVLSVTYGSGAIPVVLEALRTVVLDDVVGDFGLASGSGTLHVSWSTAAGPIVTSRTYTSVAGGGTYGQSIDPVTAFVSRMYVPGLRNDSDYRSNAGFVNGGASAATFAVRAISEEGVELGRTNVLVGANGVVQSSLAALFPNLAAHEGSITLEATGQDLFAYGSMVDNTSGDPVFFAGR